MGAGVLEERRTCGEQRPSEYSGSRMSTALPSVSSRTSDDVIEEPRPFYDLFTDSESEESLEEE